MTNLRLRAEDDAASGFDAAAFKAALRRELGALQDEPAAEPTRVVVAAMPPVEIAAMPLQEVAIVAGLDPVPFRMTVIRDNAGRIEFVDVTYKGQS